MWESDKNTRKHHIQESQEVSPFAAGDHKAATCQHSSNHWHVNQPFLMDLVMLSISPAGRGQVVKYSQLLNHMVYLDRISNLLIQNSVQLLVCKTMNRLFREFKS